MLLIKTNLLYFIFIVEQLIFKIEIEKIEIIDHNRRLFFCSSSLSF